ncbi:MAG: sulfatase-like hydrolase/transferase [Verrucomicrobia bacterium]|nr:sulfatase-like hydrolase/transferase [Verrucomicrobiota bacterium]
MPQPNIILITSDQQRRDSLSCYGSTFTTTPATDRLAAEGVVCERAYCTNPVCTPSRASIFTCQYMSRHGAWNVGTRVPGDTTMVSHRLAAAGYQTHYIGKMHFQPHGDNDPSNVESMHHWQQHYPAFTGPYFGFENIEASLGHSDYGLSGHFGAWLRTQVSEEELLRLNQMTLVGTQTFGGEAYDWDLPVRLHNSTWVTDRAVDFVQRHDGRKPFLLAIGYQDPHHPHGLPRDYAGRLAPANVPPPAFHAGELDDKPPHFMAAHHGTLADSGLLGDYKMGGQGKGHAYRSASAADIQLARAYYFSMCKLMDEQMARLLDALDAQDLTDNTLIIFTTDHGELLGDHGLWLKGPFHYDELTRVPVIIRWPHGLPAGRRTDGLLSQVDIVPTLLAAAGQPIPEELDGVNALPLLRGETDTIRPSAFVECTDDPKALRCKTIVTTTHKLTVYHGQDFGELYDLDNDPGEVTNLWNNPDYAADRERLLRQVIDHGERLERRVPRQSYS